MARLLIESEEPGRIEDSDYAEAAAKLIQGELQFKASVAAFDLQRLAEESVLGLLSCQVFAGTAGREPFSSRYSH